MKKTVLILGIFLLLSVTVVSAQVLDRPIGTVTTKVLVRGALIHGTNGLAVDDRALLVVFYRGFW